MKIKNVNYFKWPLEIKIYGFAMRYYINNCAY